MATEYCLVTTTFPTYEQAESCARDLIERNLVACVQLIPIRSIYRWQGEVLESQEVRLEAKTLLRLYRTIEDAIGENHPYEIPEIIQTPLTMASYKYLDLVRDQLISED